MVFLSDKFYFILTCTNIKPPIIDAKCIDEVVLYVIQILLTIDLNSDCKKSFHFR